MKPWPTLNVARTSLFRRFTVTNVYGTGSVKLWKIRPQNVRVPALIGWGKGGNVTSAGWQVTLCDPIWHVSSRSGEVLVAQTAIRFVTLPYEDIRIIFTVYSGTAAAAARVFRQSPPQPCHSVVVVVVVSIARRHFSSASRRRYHAAVVSDESPAAAAAASWRQ